MHQTEKKRCNPANSIVMETYRFRMGLSLSGLTNQPFIELHMQLDGHALRTTMGLDTQTEPGAKPW